ncbi:ElyC/SanA/YdcF family protein [Saccharopolyspora gregorii]|uniref:DUF218 domain-containing protein n=1 Tax=Saccharopolyspora gregorii TaxID=33914 RepID=A0ABP6RLL7_9PSEU
MLFLIPAAVLFVVFGIGFAYERRLVRNGVYLFLACLFLVGGLLMWLATYSESAAAVVLIVLALLIPLTTLALAVFLVLNGVTMLRREGRRLANVLSLAAGVGIIGFVVLRGIAGTIGWAPLEVTMDATGKVIGYVSVLFACFLLYSLVYGAFPHRRRVDFIVVLGSGLIGSRVPPLLASRLDKGLAEFRAQQEKGREPVLVTSGGQGPGEDVPEARAMADHLIANGAPPERILVEDRSRSTEENLRFSAAIMREHRPEHRALVVTNNFHVMRAARIARKEGVNAQVIGSPTARYFWPSATIREFVAVFLAHRVVNFGCAGCSSSAPCSPRSETRNGAVRPRAPPRHGNRASFRSAVPGTGAARTSGPSARRTVAAAAGAPNRIATRHAPLPLTRCSRRSCDAQRRSRPRRGAVVPRTSHRIGALLLLTALVAGCSAGPSQRPAVAYRDAEQPVAPRPAPPDRHRCRGSARPRAAR